MTAHQKEHFEAEMAASGRGKLDISVEPSDTKTGRAAVDMLRGLFSKDAVKKWKVTELEDDDEEEADEDSPS